ncbi:hypothetical protein AVEN_262103-1 [Araneus ventricosus]|uniref:Uncharacterized protein n=1 Tax=Araneus ventricosus TaxID=182803 RepID=A0A4Y2K2H6_ARAVE|nr:hypothetical protein AVEN_262103-1 [Araneus ventricosus]
MRSFPPSFFSRVIFTILGNEAISAYLGNCLPSSGNQLTEPPFRLIGQFACALGQSSHGGRGKNRQTTGSFEDPDIELVDA